ncbi:MAG TPA: cyclopropane fatty acyl phospholipid synthase [Solirubrobacterales bacterium]|nr:cyclopropane fatty acyl phospholipid synthase [Solirubrobacterales bacterium]
MDWTESLLRSLLARADVRVSPEPAERRPWDVEVADRRFFRRVAREGSLGLGESYMDGWWECDRLDEFFARLLGRGVDRFAWASPAGLASRLRQRFAAAISPERAFAVGRGHYDLGNDLFAAMLDRSMTYSCAYWQGAADLDAAQEAKLDLVCRKIGLRPGERVLDVGCGWGSLARHVAERCGARVLGVTVSREQAALARERTAGLPVEIRVADYRALDEPFDRAVSIGMFEHVEPGQYRVYFETLARCLAPGGLFLLHTIGNDRGGGAGDPWMRKHVFPLGRIPAPGQIRRAARGLFHVLDWHRLGGAHYDRTLSAWHDNFTRRWPELRARYAEKRGGRFERMWRYYLLACAGAFRAGALDVWQLVLAREPRAYQPVR